MISTDLVIQITDQREIAASKADCFARIAPDHLRQASGNAPYDFRTFIGAANVSNSSPVCHAP